MVAYKSGVMWYHSDRIRRKGELDMAVIKSQFTLRLNVADHAKIRKIAEEENRSVTNMIETIIKKEIKRYEAENGEIELTDDDLSSL